jgi:muramoyltetrapeptide carboxypeptidase
MLALAAGASLAADDERLADTWLKPRALRAGDTIQFVALSGPVNEQRVALCRERFEKMGFRISLAEKLSGRDRYLAGSDDDRVNEINAALHDPRVAAIFPCRGGYGLTRILDRIDYDALRASPKMIIGFSDVTALHLAVARKARVITFHSPMPEFSLLKDNGEYAYSFNSFWHMVRLEKHQDGPGKWDIDLPQSGPRPSTLVGGKARGRLLGGNLSLVCATLGTPYALEAKGAILFLEDTGEAPYRIDRMLSQLRLAGILSQVSGVVLGTFERTDEKEVQTVLKDYFAKLKVPVVMNFPIGHGTYNATLPHGALAELDADDLHLRLLESPVRAE